MRRFVAHGAVGVYFSKEGGGWEFQAFGALTVVVQVLLGDGAYALKGDRA